MRPASASGGHVRTHHARGSPFNIDDDVRIHTVPPLFLAYTSAHVQDDDGFGPFSDIHAAAVQGDDVSFGSGLPVHHLAGSGAGVGAGVAVGGMDGEDPFGCSSFSDDGDSSFDAFGDFGEFQSADADCFGGYDDDGHEGHERGNGNGRVGVHVEVVGRGGGVGVNGAGEGEGEFTLTPTATTGSWTFAGSEDGSPNPSPGLNLSAVPDNGQVEKSTG